MYAPTPPQPSISHYKLSAYNAALKPRCPDLWDLYRGELLPELGTPSWLELEREGYRSAYEQAAQTLVRLHLHRGDPDAAIGVARAVLPTARFNSRLWEGLRLAYERSGDHAAAARTAREHDEILAELVDGEGPS